MGKRIPLENRLWPKVDKNGPVPDYRPDLGSCWIWLAGKSTAGYGRFSIDGKALQAHRVIYELVLATPIAAGLELDHLCRVVACVNPAHMDPVTPEENRRRSFSRSAVNARKTRCSRGHEFTEANTYVTPDGDRKCRTCATEDQQARRKARGAGVASKDRTHCPQGHPYDAENTLWEANGTRRRCRACRREHFRKIDQRRTGRRRKPGAVTNAAKTHCPQGHPYDEVNTSYDSQGNRHCIACRRERDKARRQSGRKRKRVGALLR